MGGMVGEGLKSPTHAAVIAFCPVQGGADRDEKPSALRRNPSTMASRVVPSEQIADAPVMTMQPLSIVCPLPTISCDSC